MTDAADNDAVQVDKPCAVSEAKHVGRGKSEKSGQASSDLPKVERLLECMMMLIENEEHMRYSIDDIAKRLNTSPRTVYRYIKTLTNVGFVIPRPVHNVFHISQQSQALESISKAIYFTDEERHLLSAALNDMADNASTASLRQKIERTYRQALMSEIISAPHLSEKITNLQAAICGHLQVTLCSYRSGHSSSLSDRIVEPFEISSDAEYVTAFEVSSRKIKVFKISRISSVSISDLEWQFSDMHKHLKTDIFRFAGELRLPLRITLSAYAADLLAREYPLSKSYLTQNADGRFTLDTMVCEYTAAARFALGVMEQIEIDNCPEFLDFMAKKAEELNNNIKLWRSKATHY